MTFSFVIYVYDSFLHLIHYLRNKLVNLTNRMKQSGNTPTLNCCGIHNIPDITTKSNSICSSTTHGLLRRPAKRK